jgi:hypothetical protein
MSEGRRPSYSGHPVAATTVASDPPMDRGRVSSHFVFSCNDSGKIPCVGRRLFFPGGTTEFGGSWPGCDPAQV